MAKRGPKTKSSCIRFWSKVNKTDTCWLWTASTDKDGYGAFAYSGVQGKAHKYSYLLHNKKMPKKLIIDHLCRERRCVNPDHLEAVTYRENVVRGSNVFNKLSGLPIGVTNCRGRYQVAKCFYGSNIYLGLYGDPDEASIIYQTAVICD